MKTLSSLKKFKLKNVARRIQNKRHGKFYICGRMGREFAITCTYLYIRIIIYVLKPYGERCQLKII